MRWGEVGWGGVRGDPYLPKVGVGGCLWAVRVGDGVFAVGGGRRGEREGTGLEQACGCWSGTPTCPRCPPCELPAWMLFCPPADTHGPACSGE